MAAVSLQSLAQALCGEEPETPNTSLALKVIVQYERLSGKSGEITLPFHLLDVSDSIAHAYSTSSSIVRKKARPALESLRMVAQAPLRPHREHQLTRRLGRLKRHPLHQRLSSTIQDPTNPYRLMVVQIGVVPMHRIIHHTRNIKVLHIRNSICSSLECRPAEALLDQQMLMVLAHPVEAEVLAHPWHPV